MILRNIILASIYALGVAIRATGVPQSSDTTALTTSTTTSSTDPAETMSTGTSGGAFSNVRITFFNASLGACGQNNTDAEDILAISTLQWEDGTHCNKTVSITINGKTKDGVVKDRCMGCPDGGIDLTPTLFSYFADLGLGHVQGDWAFKDGSSPPS